MYVVRTWPATRRGVYTGSTRYYADLADFFDEVALHDHERARIRSWYAEGDKVYTNAPFRLERMTVDELVSTLNGDATP